LVKRRGLLILIFCHLLFSGFAQEIKPIGIFLDDSIKIGEAVNYSLSVKYPRDQDIVFPDSNYNFMPFEINYKDFFFTYSDSIYSFDSAVFNLSTFEIDTIQYLKLPVFVLSNGDSIAVFTDIDSIILEHVVTQIPDSLALIDNTIYKDLNLAFNYPYLIVGVFAFLFITGLILIFFGKDIKRKYLLYKLKKRHKKFIGDFQGIIIQNDLDFENTLFTWKKYMEKLDKSPYTRFTTKEIIKTYKDKSLVVALRTIDRAIYGGKEENEIKKRFEDLLSFSDQLYRKRLEKLKYGISD